MGINTAPSSGYLHITGTATGSVANELVLYANNADSHLAIFLSDDMSGYGSSPANFKGNSQENLMIFNYGGPGAFVFGDHVMPWSNTTYNLGASYARWNNIFSGNTVNVSSDRRLKSNIKDLNYGLKEVMALKPKTYLKHKDFNREGRGVEEIGFIAQEVETLLPELVSIPQSNKDSYGLHYSMLVPVLTKAIQEQQQQLENQAEEIQLLKQAIKQLQKALKD